MPRQRLPNRRAHKVVAFTFRGLAYTAGVERFPDGSLAEVFLDCAKGSSQAADGAKDTARSEAIRRWPDKAGLFARVKDDGRADAALIAVAGLLKKGKGP